MAFKLLPRTRENTSTVGTGSITLTGPVAPNNLTFAAQMSEGDQTFACALSSDGLTWEEGLYTMTSGQLARTGARLANSALTTSSVALAGGRVFGIIPHDIQALFVKLFNPSADDQVLTWDVGTGAFVSRYAGGRTWHRAVALATAAALPANTYNNGTSGVGATLTGNSNGALTVDGVLCVVGYRILVKDEALGGHNGIYAVTTVGDGSNPYVLTRATDFDDVASRDIQQADATVVGVAGAVNKLSIWVSVIPTPFTLGTSSIDWSMVLGLPQGGDEDQVLTIIGGVPTWADPPEGGGGSTVEDRGDWDVGNSYSAGDVVRFGANRFESNATIAASPTDAPAIDGAVATDNGLETGTVLELTTSVADDFVCVVFVTDNGSITDMTAANIDLALVDRWTNGSKAIELWTGRADGILTSEDITVTFSGAINFALYAFGVENCVGFDPSLILPKYVTTGEVVSGVTTTNAYDLIFYLSSSDNVSDYNPGEYPTGYTQIGSVSYIPVQSSLSYLSVSSEQSSITIDGDTGVTTNQALVFALTSGNPQPPYDDRWVQMSALDSIGLDVVFGDARGNMAVRGADDWVALSPGDEGSILVMGADDPAWQRAKYVLGASVGDAVLDDGQTLMIHRFAKAVTIPANFGSYLGLASNAGGTANATASTVISVDKAASASPNSFSQVGTITIASSSVTPTFASSGGTAITFAAGDVLRLRGPATADATFAGFYATIVGYET